MRQKQRRKSIAEGPAKALQVKPIFSVAPQVAEGDTVTLHLHLASSVLRAETYLFAVDPLSDGKATFRDSDGDLIDDGTEGSRDSKKEFEVKDGNATTLTARGVSAGWIFFRITEKEKHGQVEGAVRVLKKAKASRR